MEIQVKDQSRPPAAVSRDLFTRTAEIATDWLQSLDKRPVASRQPSTNCVRGSVARSPAALSIHWWWWRSWLVRPSRD